MKTRIPISTKLEYIRLMEEDGVTAYRAFQKLKEEYPLVKDASQVLRWYKNRESLRKTSLLKCRAAGGGRKALLGVLEELLFEDIMHLRMNNVQVKRSWIRSRATEMARSNNLINFKGSSGWLNNFMKRKKLSLRRVTNLTRLSDAEVAERAAKYFVFLHSTIDSKQVLPQDVVLMDETAVYFETAHRSTVSLSGARHVMMKTTGFASMRVTAVMAVRADGSKLRPLIIFKGAPSRSSTFDSKTGCWITKQSRGWVDTELLKTWLHYVFPPFSSSTRARIIVWDSCRAHISKEIKAYCSVRNIKMAVIPGGMTAYLQCGDIAYFKPFKDSLSNLIESWKHSTDVMYTPAGNPRPPSKEAVAKWVKEAWKSVSDDMVKIGLLRDIDQWFIARHDKYGRTFRNKYNELIGSIATSSSVQDENPSDEPFDDPMDIIDDEESA